MPTLRPTTPVRVMLATFLLLQCLTVLGAPGGIPLDPVPTLVVFTPVSVEVDPRDGTLWIADQYASRVAHLTPQGAPISVFSAGRYGGGKPAGVTFEGPTADYLFVSDPDLHRLARIDRSGNFAGAIPTDVLGITHPADLAWDETTATLWVADPLARQVSRLRPRDSDADGLPDTADLVTSFSTIPLGSDNPMGIATVAATGHLFLSDPALDRVMEVTSAGGLVASFDSGFPGGTSVTGLAWDPVAGNLRLADAGRKILTMTAGGGYLGVLGTAPFGSLSPQGLSWDSATGTLLAVTGERKMLRFQPDAPDGAGNHDGILLWRQEPTTAFSSLAPSGIAFDPGTGDRFVSDSLQHRVFRVDAAGGVLSSFDASPAGSLSPTGLSLGPAGGSLFLSDAQARKVLEVALDGTLLASFSTSPFKRMPHSEPLCDDPEGVAYDPSTDHLLLVDPQAGRLFEVTRNGNFVAAFPTAPAAPYPTDLALDPAGDRVIVSDSSGTLAEFSRSGQLRGTYPGVPLRVRIPGASDVSIDHATLHRVITDPILDAVLFLSRSGSALGQISLEPYGIRAPSGAAWSAVENRLYVVDRSLQKLFALSPGMDGTFGTADDSSSFLSTAVEGSDAPRGVTLDPALGRVGWGDEISPRITWVTTSFAYVGMVDLQPAGATQLRGVDQDPTSRSLFATDLVAGILTTTSSGGLVHATPTAPLGILDPGGSGLSPSEGVLMVVDLSDRTLVPVDLRSFFLPEVTGLSLGPSGEINWVPLDVFSGYHLFRGALAGLAAGSWGGCFWSGLAPPVPDAGLPPPGEGWFYLVVGTNPTGVGSPGSRSDGTERSLAGVEPACP